MFTYVSLSSRGAKVRFGRWILKAKDPTQNSHTLNAQMVLVTVSAHLLQINGNNMDGHRHPVLPSQGLQCPTQTQNNIGCLWYPPSFSPLIF